MTTSLTDPDLTGMTRSVVAVTGGFVQRPLGLAQAAFVAVTNSQSNSSSHALFTASLEAAFDFLQRAHTLAFEMALARDGIHRRRRETMLNL